MESRRTGLCLAKTTSVLSVLLDFGSGVVDTPTGDPYYRCEWRPKLRGSFHVRRLQFRALRRTQFRRVPPRSFWLYPFPESGIFFENQCPDFPVSSISVSLGHGVRPRAVAEVSAMET